MLSLDRLLSWQTDEELTPCPPRLDPQVGVAKLNSWAAKYTIAGDSSVRKAIVDALQTETEDDSEVLLNLNAVSGRQCLAYASSCGPVLLQSHFWCVCCSRSCSASCSRRAYSALHGN